jgi:hypothetical protein
LRDFTRGEQAVIELGGLIGHRERERRLAQSLDVAGNETVARCVAGLADIEPFTKCGCLLCERIGAERNPFPVDALARHRDDRAILSTAALSAIASSADSSTWIAFRRG